MKNKGFSIIECIACMFLLSTVTIGIVSTCLVIEHSNNERLYVNTLYTNYHTIFRICDLTTNPKKELVEIYQDQVKEVGKSHLKISIKLEKKYLKKEVIEYYISFYEDQANLIVKVQILDLESKYEEINNEILSQRYYPK
jgi:hypothetical protein